MFQFPQQTAVNRVVHKTKIYDKARPTKAVRDLFVSEVEQIVWRNKLSPETLRLAPADGIEEIQVFEIVLKGSDLSSRVLEMIDRAIPYPVFFRLARAKTLRYAACYKRPAQDGSAKWVFGDYYHTAWTTEVISSAPLPVSLDLRNLYDQMLRTFIALPAREGEKLPDFLERDNRVRQLQRRLKQFETKLRAEKQFNRKVELNAEVRRLDSELNSLMR